MENPPQISLSELLRKLSELGGSDLHVTTGTPPLVRVHGTIRPLDGYKPLTSSETKQLAYSFPPMLKSIVSKRIWSSTSVLASKVYRDFVRTSLIKEAPSGRSFAPF